MEFCDKESLLLFSLSSSRCLWAIDLIVTTIICRQWFQLKWFLAMIWPWLLFDYYHPKSSKSRFAQCFQWFSRNSAKQDVFGKNRTTLENTAFYPLMPENSDRRHCSCQALSLCKKARRKLMHLSLRLAFARTDCTPMTHCVPKGWNSWNFWAFRADIFLGSAWWQAEPFKITMISPVFSRVSVTFGNLFPRWRSVLFNGHCATQKDIA